MKGSLLEPCSTMLTVHKQALSICSISHFFPENLFIYFIHFVICTLDKKLQSHKHELSGKHTMDEAYFESKNTISIVCKVKILRAVHGASSQKMPRAWPKQTSVY